MNFDRGILLVKLLIIAFIASSMSSPRCDYVFNISHDHANIFVHTKTVINSRMGS